MPVVRFTCPHCAATTLVEEQFVGQSGPCAGCGQTVTIVGPITEFGTRHRRSWWGQALGCLLMFVACALVVALVFVGVSSWMGDFQRQECAGHLAQLGAALESYHDDFGCYPPASLPGADGQPAHSWRILVAPYLGASHVYERYDFSEPWNGPHNRELAQEMPSALGCPASPEAGLGHTSYVAVVGPGLFWDPTAVRRRGDVRDPPRKTIILVETAAANPPFEWLAPRDLDFSSMSQQMNRFDRPGPASLHTTGVVHVLLADGTTAALDHETKPARFAASLTIAGGESLSPPELASAPPAPSASLQPAADAPPSSNAPAR